MKTYRCYLLIQVSLNMGFLGIKYPEIFIPEIGMSRIYVSLLTYNGKKK